MTKGETIKQRIRRHQDRGESWLQPRDDARSLDLWQRLETVAFNPDYFIDLVPRRRALFVHVPKAACTSIKASLSLLETGRWPATIDAAHQRSQTGLLSPRQNGLDRFFAMVDDPAVFKFSFVRHPYARLVSCWRDKIAPFRLGGPPGWLHLLLAQPEADTLRLAPDETLSFAEFVRLASACAGRRVDGHWSLMADIVPRSGLDLDFIGKVERFAADFRYVMTRVGGLPLLDDTALPHWNQAPAIAAPDPPDGDLARQIYTAYEEDFDRFEYPRQCR